MYLCVQKSKGIPYLVLMDSKYDVQAHKQVKRRVQSFGNLDKLKKDEPKKLEEIYAKYGGQKEAAEAARKAALELYSTLGDSVADAKSGKLPVFKLAALILHRIWNEELLMDEFLARVQRTEHSRIEYSPAGIAYYFALVKLLDPMSHYMGHRECEQLLGNPLGETSLQDIYRGLGYLSEHKNTIMRHVNVRLSKHYPRNLSLMFYDCTNCYFETPYNDAYWYRCKAYRYVRRQLRKDNPELKQLSNSALDEYIATHSAYLKMVNSRLDALGEPMRMQGHSKEKRTDLPLVSIALVIDEHGIPFDFEVYPGNSNEQATMKKSVTELKGKYRIKNCMWVADNGLNGTANLKMLLGEDMGFSVAQSARQLSTGDRLRHVVPKEQMSPIPDTGGQVLYRIAPITRKSRIKNEDGTWKTVTVDCQIMMTYSEERRKRDLEALEALLERQRNSKNPDVHVMSANTERKHRDCAGYAGVLFKAPPGMNETDLPPEYISGLYQKLVKIEECFRIMKDSFNLRPMYVYTKPSITGHVLICVLALCLMRILQIKLDASGVHLSPEQITKALNEAEVAAVHTKMGDSILNLGRIHMTEDTKGRNRRAAADHTDALLSALGVKPLPKVSSMTDLRRYFGLKQLQFTAAQLEWLQRSGETEISVPNIST